MKISASIYSVKDKSPEQLVKELDAHGIDMLHVDCPDSDKVFDDIARIRKISSTPIDLHIISAEPEKYFKKIEELRIEYVSFQYENLKSIPVLPKTSSTQFGLSIVSSTPLSVFQNDVSLNGVEGFSFVMMMSTVPGQSGGEFNRDSFQKIIEFRNRFPKTRIHVDGGVNDEIAYILRVLGVHAVVSGSYLMNHESLGMGMLSFHRSANGHSKFRVAEFATPVKYLPVLEQGELNLENVLQTIEKGGLGFVLVTDQAGQLAGVISNADVRRGLLKNLGNLGKTDAGALVNPKPVHIQQDW